MNDEHASVATPVAEYQLAGSPRRLAGDGTGASTSTTTSAAFKLKSPFKRCEDGGMEHEASDAGDMSSDGFIDQMVDEVVDSPSKAAASNSALEHIHEEDAAAVAKEAEEDKLPEDDDEYRYVYLNNPEANERQGYCCNTVITSRFTIYNFIPKLLFYEFSKLANAYFLVISVMQTIKPISNTGGFPASLPALSIIVLIDMFFACLEDYKRHKADHIANELPCLQYSLATRTFEKSKWHSLHVGDIVKVHNRESVPADLVILAACEPEPENPAGICYVETKSLDGETNLKLRQGLEATYTTMLSDEKIADLTGVVVCDKPNNAIHRFNGTMSLSNGKKEVITANAVLLRGSTLRNTEYIYGLVVNTGPDTKIMMASSNTPMKWSNMEKRLNQQIAYICTLMIILCLTGAIISTIWNAKNLSDKPDEGAWYLFDKKAIAVRSPVGNFFIQVLYYFLLLNSFIPVSLYVSMTSVKFMQAFFMNNDLEMYYEETDTPCQVRTMSLNEELGQIDYIFSDKTGTLTCNIMEFRKCSINGVSYGLGQTEVGIAAEKRRMAEGNNDAHSKTDTTIMEEKDDEDLDPKHGHRVVKAPYVNYQDDTIFDALALNDKHARTISAFFEHLSVCHTVMPERASDGSVRLSASSPDEQALVAAAACFGYKFSARSPGKAMVQYFSCLENNEPPVGGDSQVGEYEILEVLEFNSTRKRMSVIMRGPNGELKLLCKGADTVMYERLRPTTDTRVLHVRNQTLTHMETFASEGLRTLVIGSTDVDPAFYEGWVIRYRTAINDMRQIELRRLGEPNDIDRCMEEIEVNLEVLGATAIEDRLQAGVPDTIHRLRQATIKIWMLTGDKEETAINIGFACRLLTPDIERVVISADTHPDLDSIVEELERYANHPGEDPSTLGPKNGKGKHDGATANGDGSASEDSEDTRPLTRIESVANFTTNQEALALVIDGETLELALEECPMLLLSIALKCVAVIACRVSPAQKAELVRLVRDNNPKVRTLAIGDGANDVSMIQCAHVGVGISGQEGMQAANSADYAIAQFRFLSRLLLVHGRWNYVRMGKLILYIFYKNVMMNLTQFWYMIFTGFSGQKFFLEWGLQGYNLIFTALPIVLISTFEQDVPAFYAHNYPVLYRVGQENSHFNTKIVWAWISSCVWESLVISFGTIYGMRYLINNGDTPTMWVYGCVAFTIVVLVVTLKLCLHQQMWWPLVHIPIYFVSYSLWIATAALISYGNSVSSAYWNGVFTNVFATKVFWLLMPLIVFTALSRDFLWKGYMRAFQPSYKHLAQEVNAFGLKHLADYLLSFPPPESIPRDSEAGVRPSLTIMEPKKTKKQSAITAAAATAAARLTTKGSLGMSRKSFTRGSAFSYDAESVMVESFMATERYNSERLDTKPIFERHASRGSMAFHTFLGDTGLRTWILGPPSSANATADTANQGEQGPPGRNQRQHSAGNIFRGARHSFGRKRFFSVSNIGNTGAASSPMTPLGESPRIPARESSNRSLRRYERAQSGEMTPTRDAPLGQERHSLANARPLRRYASTEGRTRQNSA